MITKFVPTFEAVQYTGDNAQQVHDFVAERWSDENEVTVVQENGKLFLRWGYYDMDQEINEGDWVHENSQILPDSYVIEKFTKLSDLLNQ